MTEFFSRAVLDLMVSDNFSLFAQESGLGYGQITDCLKLGLISENRDGGLCWTNCDQEISMKAYESMRRMNLDLSNPMPGYIIASEDE